MMEMIQEKQEQGRKSIVFELMEDKNKDRLTSSVIAGAIEENDAAMKEALQTAQYYLGLLTANLVNSLDPQVIVFWGGLVKRLGETFVEPVAVTARKHYFVQENSERIRIVPTALGDDAGPVGAAVVVMRRLQGASRGLSSG